MWYSSQSRFVWVDGEGESHTILQGEGGEQGDALMPALFSLALHPALLRMRGILHSTVSILAYLDDIHIVCEPRQVSLCLHTARSCLRDVCHIDVNMGKLAAWSKSVTDCPEWLEGLDANGEPICKCALDQERQ